MELGIIACWKIRYRHHMLRENVRDIERRAKKRDINMKKTTGAKGMSDGYDPHMLYVS